MAGAGLLNALRWCQTARHADTASLSQATQAGQTMLDKGRGFKTRLAGILTRAQMAQGSVLMTWVNGDSQL